ncbi:MAG: hypothetical protein AAF066_19580 [Pseudomonadota bacterium]
MIMFEALYHRVYLWGYNGHQLPRGLRYALAGSHIHRAWFLGFNGFFLREGTSYGLAHPYPATESSASVGGGA